MNDLKGSLFQALADAKKLYNKTDEQVNTTEQEMVPSCAVPPQIQPHNSTPAENTSYPFIPKSQGIKRKKNSKKTTPSTKEVHLSSQEISSDSALFFNTLAQAPPQKEKESFFASPFDVLENKQSKKTNKKQKKYAQNPERKQSLTASLTQDVPTQALSAQQKEQHKNKNVELPLTEDALWAAATQGKIIKRQTTKKIGSKSALMQELSMPANIPSDVASNSPLNEKIDPEVNLFTQAMAGVEPISAKGREVAANNTPTTATPIAGADLATLLAENFEFALAHTDEYLEGFVVGTDPLVVNKLKGGQYSPEAHLDLHGQNAKQALDALLWFIKNSYQRHLRCILIITGRGKNSPDKIGILRGHVQNWLTREPFKRVVIAFCTAKQCDGGTGAVYVLLRKFKKARGKIIWERLPYSDEYYDI